MTSISHNTLLRHLITSCIYILSMAYAVERMTWKRSPFFFTYQIIVDHLNTRWNFNISTMDCHKAACNRQVIYIVCTLNSICIFIGFRLIYNILTVYNVCIWAVYHSLTHSLHPWKFPRTPLIANKLYKICHKKHKLHTSEVGIFRG